VPGESRISGEWRIPVSARQGSGFANYAARACECRPRFLCRFCRESLSRSNTHARKGAKSRQRAAQPRKQLPQSGSSVGYRQAHRRVEAARGHATSYPCEDCREPAAEWAYLHTDPDELCASATESHASTAQTATSIGRPVFDAIAGTTPHNGRSGFSRAGSTHNPYGT
jgi:hypothetical protein